MHAILLSVALLAAAHSSADVAIQSEPLGIAFRCPRALCDADAAIRATQDASWVLSGVRGCSENEVIAISPEVTLESAYAIHQALLGKRFTLSYKRLKAGAFAVLSGLGRGKDAGSVLYEKLVPGKQGIVGLRFVYPAARKAELDPVVARLMSSFAPSGEGLRVTTQQAWAMISALPEVETLHKSNAEVEKRNKSPFYVSVEESPSPQSKPGTKEACYQVDVGYMHDDEISRRAERVLQFCVDGFSGQISVNDVACDVSVPLEAWRKIRNDEDCARFQKYAP